MDAANAYHAQRAVIEAASGTRESITPGSAGADLLATIESVIAGMEQGVLRVAEPTVGGWRVNAWLTKAVLLYFRVRHNRVDDRTRAKTGVNELLRAGVES